MFNFNFSLILGFLILGMLDATPGMSNAISAEVCHISSLDYPSNGNICLCLISVFIFVIKQMEYSIYHTWDSLPVNHDPVKIRFSPGEGGLRMQVEAPFFNDPTAPPGPPGPFPGLWDFEGVWISSGNHIICVSESVCVLLYTH